MNKALFAMCAAALVASCGTQQQEAAGSGTNQLMPSAEARTGASQQAGAGNQIVAVDAETAKRLMHERHENYEKIGDAMKRVTRELKAESPDLQSVREGATVIATLAPQVPSWFPAGTGPDAGKTHAKAEIWQRPEDFEAKAKAFAQAAATFQSTTQGSDLAAMREAHSNLGQACKACHDLYREKD